MYGLGLAITESFIMTYDPCRISYRLALLVLRVSSLIVGQVMPKTILE